MDISRAVLVSGLMLAACDAAAAQSISLRQNYKILVEQQAAIGTNGSVDLGKIYVSVRPSSAAQAVTANASIYSVGSDGTQTLVVTLGCHFGDLAAGQTAIYRGVSCDSAPTFPFAPPGRLKAAVSVIATHATPARSVPVKRLPTP